MRKNKSIGVQPAGQPSPPSTVGTATGTGIDAEFLFQGLPWGVVVLSAHGTVLRLNQQAAHWWGNSLQALQGEELGQLTAGALPADLWQALQRVPSGPPPPGEFFLPRPQQWIAMSSARHADGWVVYWQDVTAQKQRQYENEHRQAASDSLLGRTEAAARTGSYEMELATGCLHFSDGLYRLFGEEPGAFVPEVALINARSHPDDVAGVQQVLAQAVADCQPYSYQRRIYRSDGQLRTLEAHGRVECDAQGQPLRLLGLLQDVTERERAAQELLRAQDELARRATDNYVALYNSMDEGFCIIEVLFDVAEHPFDYRFLDVNPAFEKQTGLHGALGKTVRELVPAHEQHWFDTYGRVARTGQPTRFEAQGEAMGRWFDVNAFPIGPPKHRHVAILFADITERKQTQEDLRQSEARYRSLFANMEQGFSLIEKIATAPHEPSDYRYLVVNPAFGRHTGLIVAAGQTIREVIPGIEPHIMAIYDEVVASGEPRRAETYVAGLDLWFEVEVILEAQPGRLAVLFSNVSVRRRAEQTLRESEARQAYLLALSDALLPVADAVAVQATVTQTALCYFEADRCHYAEVAGDTVIIRRDAARPGLPSVIGEYSLNSMPLFSAALQGGQPLVTADVEASPLMNDISRQICRDTHIRASIHVPVMRTGKLVGILCLIQVTPRAWTALDVALLQETAERTWTAVEQARAEEALRVSEAKYRTLFDSIDEGFVVSELLYDEQGRAVDALMLETNPSYDRITQTTGAAGRRAREFFPAAESAWFEMYAQVVKTGEGVRFENYFAPLDRWIEMFVVRMGGAGSRHFASVFNDTTERKRHENHAAFLDELSQALAVLNDPDEIVRATGELLGTYLGVGFLNVVDVKLEGGDEPAEARITVAFAWEREGLPSPRSTYRAGDYLSQEFLRAARAGEPIVIRDTDPDPRVDAEAYRAIGMRAFVAVPVLNAQGAWPGLISAFTPSPRDWRPDEVKLLVEMANRVFLRIEHARAEEALRRSEEQFRLFVTASSDVLFRMDANWQHMLRLDGRRVLADTAAPTASWLEAYIPPADRPIVEVAIQAAIAGPHFFTLEHRVLCADGSLGWMSSHAVPVLNAQGELVEWFGTATDITARQRAEEALRVSEAKYRILFETMDQGFGVGEVLPAGPGRAADFRWLEVNPQVERLTGMPQAALLSGETMRVVMPQLEDIWYERYEQVALTGEPVRFEEHAQVLGRWFDVYAYALDGPAPHHVALLFTNITARKQAEEDLRHAEEHHRERLEQQVAERTQALGESQVRLQSVFDSITNAVALLRVVRDGAGGILDFEYVLVNPVTQAYHGGQNLVGRRYRDLLRGTQRQAAFKQLAAIVETGRRADFEVLDDYEGHNHWFRLVGVKVDDGVLYTAEDITPRKLLEQVQARSLALLQQSEAVAVMGSWEYDLESRKFTWSDGLYHLFELPMGSAVELQFFLDAVLDDDRPAAAKLVRTLTTGAAGFDTTLRLHVGDAVKTVRFKAVPIPDAPGTPERVLGVCLDVSDMQRLEAENLALKLDRHKELLLAILQAQENERRRLGEVLHNGLGQILYATKLHLDQLDTPALHALPVLSNLHQQTGRLLADAMRQTRTLAHELVPTSLVDFGLAAAVRDICQDLSTPQLRVACQIWDEGQVLPQPVQVTLFRLAQELVHNIVRHAEATQAMLELEILPRWVSLRAEDNGRGFDPLIVAEGLGLRTVRDAVALLGGTVAMDSSPEFGTHVRLRIPLPLFS